jgi:hypothetical protein
MRKRERENEEHEDREKCEHPHARRDGKDRKVILDITARRMAGGAPATPQAYASALEQWRKLPGAVVSPPTDLRTVRPEPSASENPKPPAPANNAGSKEPSS